VSIVLGLESLFDLATNNRGAVCALWAFGPAFQYFSGEEYVESWNTRHGEECFYMSLDDYPPNSVREIVKHWRLSMSKKKVNQGAHAPETLPKGKAPGCDTISTELSTSAIIEELDSASALARKAGQLALLSAERCDKIEREQERVNKQLGKADKNFCVMAKGIKANDANLAESIKVIITLKKLFASLSIRLGNKYKLNHKLTQKVTHMATDIEKIKARMQVANKKVAQAKPKVQAKVANAHNKANAKLPKAFGKVR
jgi:hypothetical protein